MGEGGQEGVLGDEVGEEEEDEEGGQEDEGGGQQGEFEEPAVGWLGRSEHHWSEEDRNVVREGVTYVGDCEGDDQDDEDVGEDGDEGVEAEEGSQEDKGGGAEEEVGEEAEGGLEDGW